MIFVVFQCVFSFLQLSHRQVASIPLLLLMVCENDCIKFTNTAGDCFINLRHLTEFLSFVAVCLFIVF